MKSGSVIVDMAPPGNGSSRTTVWSSWTTRIFRPGSRPRASQFFETNLLNLLKLLTPDKDEVLRIDFYDVVQRSVTVVRDGGKTWPPPPVQTSAAPAVTRVSYRLLARPGN